MTLRFSEPEGPPLKNTHLKRTIELLRSASGWCRTLFYKSPISRNLRLHSHTGPSDNILYKSIRNLNRDMAYNACATPAFQTCDFMEFSYTNENLTSLCYEPLRTNTFPIPPPKRFYRTFWRSIARALLKQQITEG